MDLRFILFWLTLVIADLNIRGDLWTCVAERQCSIACEFAPVKYGEIIIKENLRHCKDDHFGMNCNAYSPECHVDSDKCPFLDPVRETQCDYFEKARNIFVGLFGETTCRAHYCIERYQEKVCEQSCEPCAKSDSVGCYEGLCFYTDEQRPARVCAYGYGRKKLRKNKLAVFWKCEKCIDSEKHCGSKELTCSHEDFSKCSCNPDDFENGIVPSNCRRCAIGSWGNGCKEICFCSKDADCDADTGACVCKPDKPDCDRCINKNTGDRCDVGCLVHCFEHPGVKCAQDACVIDPEMAVPRYCPYGYGYSRVGSVEGRTSVHCVPCFLDFTVYPTCGITSGSMAYCSESAPDHCSCFYKDYPDGLVPEGCRACEEGKWGLNCDNDCLCGPTAVCDARDGTCACPPGADGAPTDCMRCVAMKTGAKCDVDCTGHCHLDDRVACEEDRCRTTDANIRPCAYGYGAVGGLKAAKRKEGTLCAPCFSDELRDTCGSDEVVCSVYNISRCSCSQIDYEFEQPVNCRVCPQGKYGRHCQHECKCHAKAFCEALTGDCFCISSPECAKNPCKEGFKLTNVTQRDLTVKEVCTEIIPDPEKMPLNVQFTPYFLKLFGPAIFIPMFILVSALIGCVVEIVLERKRIFFVYRQHFRQELLEVERLFADNYTVEASEKVRTGKSKTK